MLPRLDTSWIKKLNNGLNIKIKAIPRYEKKKQKLCTKILLIIHNFTIIITLQNVWKQLKLEVNYGNPGVI